MNPDPSPVRPANDTLRSANEMNANPSSDGAMSVSIGGVSLRIEKCALREISPTVSHCTGDTYVDLQKDGTSHSILLTSLYLDREATFYRGPLDASYKRNGHSFVMTDVDGDGREDLIVWTGKEGTYGGPSYEVLLFNQETKQFEVAPMLSELTVGANGLFSVESGRLKLSSSDGCCMRVFDTYAVEHGEPKLIERVTEKRDEQGGHATTKTERLVDGKLQEVTQP